MICSIAYNTPHEYIKSDLSKEKVEILYYLQLLSTDYPNITDWYLKKVIPGLEFGTRRIEVVRDKGNIIALAIAKKDTQEKKICTIRVSPGYEKHGLGSGLFQRMLDYLETETPHITVPEDKVPQFKRLFDYYGFSLTSTHNGLYKPDKVEFLFNQPSMDRITGSKNY